MEARSGSYTYETPSRRITPLEPDEHLRGVGGELDGPSGPGPDDGGGGAEVEALGRARQHDSAGQMVVDSIMGG